MYDQPTLSLNSFVRIKGHTDIGKVIKINKYKATVMIDNVTFYLPIKAYEVVEAADVTKYTNVTLPKKRSYMTSKATLQTTATLDLHGLNREQALFAVEKFLDRSLLLHCDQIRIIHGKGKGILRHAVRGYLRQHHLVKDIVVESPICCMNGLTIVIL